MNKHYLLYGLLVGVLLLIVQTLKHNFMIQEIELEVFGLVLVLLAIPVGVLLGRSWVRKQAVKSVNYKTASQDVLSEREMDVLKLVAQGHSNQEIADQLFVSLNTTKTHISSIYQKLGAQRRTQAVQKAIEIGIIQQSET
ncbi:MAG: response regulator transcription factor [Cyclobacteriaceae bacterium]